MVAANVRRRNHVGWRDGRAAASRSGHFVFSPFRSKIWLEAENAALRHQLIVLRRNVPIRSLMLSLCKPAGCELFERTTRRYGKPEWGLDDTEVSGVRTPIEIRTVWEKPFCRLLHFDRKMIRPLRAPQPRVLIVAPMSGHYATLLRGTVEAFLPTHEVYITDWAD